MAERDEGQERSFDATPKRRADARDRGQVPRSRELATMGLLGGAAAGFALTGSHLAQALERGMRSSFAVERSLLSDGHGLVDFAIRQLVLALGGVAPFLALMLIVALAAPIAVGGWVFSLEAMSFKFGRMDPVEGIKRVLGPRGWLELGKSLVKFVLILGVAIAVIWFQLDRLLALGREDLPVAIGQSMHLVLVIGAVVAAATAVVALVDVPFQIWDHNRNLKMTREEIREETKETDGRPEVKGRIRQLQQEASRRRMMEQVPKADVIVTNPTHYAVALRYDPQAGAAPVVVARGADHLAARIREVGIEHRVAVLSAPPLARALYHTTRLDQEIPAGLYRAVAQVLAHVFQLRALRPGQAVPVLPAELPIPKEFRFDR